MNNCHLRLKKAVMLSRHNLRSPIFGIDTVLKEITPHQWFAWDVPEGGLTTRGAELERLFGRYFHEYLSEHELLTNDRIRIYANSLTRAIDTARNFADTAFPDRYIPVEYHCEPGTRDPVFAMKLDLKRDGVKDRILGEMRQYYETHDFERSLRVLERVIDYAGSAHSKAAGQHELDPRDFRIILNDGCQPAIEGTLKLAVTAADALLLQYYEEPDALRAGFGHPMSGCDWAEIGNIYLIYENLLFSTPHAAINTACPLIGLIYEELLRSDREFCGLFGHDCNIIALLSAIGAAPIRMPNTLTKNTPIGCKLLFEIWSGPDGTDYVSLKMLYQSTEQIRGRTGLALSAPPVCAPFRISGLQSFGGYYLLSDILRRFENAITGILPG